MKSVLTIAGSDSSGGAGIQADIKTIEALGAFAQSAVAVLTAQNTMGVSGALNIESSFLQEQIAAVFEDIIPQAVKIGILGTKENVSTVANALQKYEAKHIVLDPVMVATSGSSLANNEVVSAMCKELFCLAEIITPNIFEAETLAGYKITSKELQEQAARDLLKYGSSWVLVKGGHSLNESADSASAENSCANGANGEANGANTKDTNNESADDVLVGKDGSSYWICGNRLQTKNTHGTGCSLSSAIACTLAFGYNVHEACIIAKKYVYHAIKDDLELGKGSGPINHMWPHINEKRDIHFLFEHMLEKAK